MKNYIYRAKDQDLKNFGENFANRIGDGSGQHEREYFDMVQLLIALKRNGSLLDIGAGHGRVTALAKNNIAEYVALEPDFERWEQCHKEHHKPPQTQVLQLFSSQFIAQNPGKTFDFVVLGMVIQHLSTSAAKALLADVATLLKPDGVAIVCTTHTLDAGRGFSFSKSPPDQVFLSEAEFNAYADAPGDESKGIPVHRFSKAELSAYLEPHFDTVYWRQISYYREHSVGAFESRLKLPAGTLQDVGNSQFAVLRKK